MDGETKLRRCCLRRLLSQRVWRRRCKRRPKTGNDRFGWSVSFTIMLLADAQDTNRTKPDTVELIEASLDEVKPDLSS